jgi:DNA-binding CsgD family transcriptional regulator
LRQSERIIYSKKGKKSMNELSKSIFGSEYFDDNETTNIFTNNILNNLSAFVFILDTESIIPVWINEYFYKRMGYTNDDVKSATPESFLELFHPVSQKQLLRKIRSLEFVDGSDDKTLYEIKTKDQQWIHLLVCSKVCKRNSDGKAKYLLGYGVEVNRSELKHHLHRLKELENTCLNLDLINRLSSREIEIIRLIAKGLTDKEIATKFNISIHTTKTHRKRIISKLGLKNSAVLVKFAFENGLI